ncbi:branched-chain amino acid ABC transporter permease [Agrobacterium sp. NPDC090283]|uniref:branched-chain amino acid ABC transporter permease n=1 Tax=Agrobacterium sp. NPDC090283 TaxID=3363920 RepID=UPI003839D8F3
MTHRSSAVERLASPRPRLFELLVWLMPAAAYFLFPDNLLLGISIMTYAVAVLGLDLLLGYAGIVSLGHAAFFGVGAYTAGLLAVNGWQEPLSGLLLAGAASLALGYLASLLVVRGKDLSRLMVTLGIGLVVYEVANRMSGITGGVDGLSGIEIAPIFGTFTFDLYGRTSWWYAYGVSLLVFVFLRLIVSSPFGLSLRGIRDGANRMPALGASVNSRLRIAFTLSAGIAGIAGGLLAQTTQFVGVDSLSVPRAAEFLVMLVLGGTGRLYGALAGTAIFMIAREYLADVDPVYWEFWMGILLMAVVLFARGGVVGALFTYLPVLRTRFGRGAQ